MALVTLRPGNQIVVRDITDIGHPSTVSSISEAQPRFVSASSLSFQNWVEAGLSTSLYLSPLSGSPSTKALNAIDGIVQYAWSRDGKALAYLTPTRSGMALHLKRAGDDRTVGYLPDSGAPDFALAYSPDGAYIAVVANDPSNYLHLWDASGVSRWSYAGSAATMPVWLGGGLYFRDAKGIQVWRDGEISTFLAGVDWIGAKGSPDGRSIVYQARDPQGSSHIFVVDTTSGQVTDLGGKGREAPAFLTDRYVWYQAEPACVAAKTCQPLEPGFATGKTYVYDLKDHTEVSSIITFVFDVWPHAA